MQLDLFIDPPPPMNPNLNPINPDCFRDYNQYAEWLRMARLAKESCTICEDCRPEYKAKMVAQERCHEKWHSSKVLIQREVAKKNYPIPNPIDKQNVRFSNDGLAW